MVTPPREAGARPTSSSRCGSSGPRRSAPDDDARWYSLSLCRRGPAAGWRPRPRL